MTTNFKINQSIGNYQVDIDDILIRREYFSDGGLWTWGQNSIGQLGDNTTVNKSSPVTTVSGGTNWKQVAGGRDFIAAIKTDGTLWLCGYNNFGNLGDNTAVNKSSPVTTVAGGTNWKQVTIGYVHASAIKTDGTLWTWGSNSLGQLGDNTTVNKSSPVTTVAGGTNWKQVACGAYQTAAIKTDGTLWTWGSNFGGALGDNTTVSKSSPVTTVAGGTNWKQVSGGREHITAIKTDGTLWSWGLNNLGQLGDNTVVSKTSPIQPSGGGTNWKQVSCGQYYAAAIKTDGTLWTWGSNSIGQLGDNTTVDKSNPVTTVAGGTNWKQVAVLQYHISAIKTDGTLWTWGSNSSGQLGDNTTVNKSSPVTTVAGGTNWKQVAVGGNQTFATTDLTIGTY